MLEFAKVVASVMIVLAGGCIAAVLWTFLPLVVGFPLGLAVCGLAGFSVIKYVYGSY